MEITSLKATISGTTISVNGTAKSNVLAVQIVIYDKDGTNIIKMYSTATNADGTFSADIAVDTNDIYIVRAADYDGGEVASVTVGEVAEEAAASEETAGAPATGYQAITKTEEATPATNAATSSAIIISLAIGMIIAAAVVFGARIAFAKRRS